MAHAARHEPRSWRGLLLAHQRRQPEEADIQNIAGLGHPDQKQSQLQRWPSFLNNGGHDPWADIATRGIAISLVTSAIVAGADCFLFFPNLQATEESRASVAPPLLRDYTYN